MALRGARRALAMGVIGGATALTDPSTLSGLGLWIDANDPATLFQDSAGTTPAAADGDPVGRAGRVATNLATQTTTSNKPSLKLNILNGKPVIRFGEDDFLSLANLALLKNIGSVQVFAVLKYPDDTASRVAFMYSTTTESVARSNLFIVGTPAKFTMGGRRLDADSFQAVASTVFNANYNIQTAHWDYVNSDAYLYLNGAQIATSTAFQTDGNTSNTNSLEGYVGRTGGPTPLSFAGDLAELLLYTPALSAPNVARIHQYLATKWGITLS